MSRFHFRRTVLALVTCALAGCGTGGSHSTSAPAVPTAPLGAVRDTTTFPPGGELFVASGSGSPNAIVYEYSAQASGNAPSPDRSVSVHPNTANNTIAGIAVQPDGTLDVLQTYVVGSTSHCKVTVEPPGANGVAAALANIDCGTTSDAITYDSSGGGFLLATYDFGAQISHVVRYTKAGGLVGTPISRNGFFIGALATDRGGHIYVEDTGGNVIKYKSDGTPGNPVGGFSVGVAGPIAVGPDLTLYAAGPDSLQDAVINVFTPADYSGSGVPSRTYGPFDNSTITALAVDAAGELYVAMEPKSFGENRVRVFAADAPSGKPAPVRALLNPDPTLNIIRGLAIAQPSS